MDLVFLGGGRAGGAFFLVFRGGRAGGAFFLENYHYPFDLQVGPLLGTQGEGGGRELAPSRQILESTLQIELLKYYCRLMKYGDCTVNRWY